MLERWAGPAGQFHARTVPQPVRRALWWFEVDGPTVVLGSTQPDRVVDRAEARARGVRVARRRSGGGAVWLSPGDVTWLDVILPAGDPLWLDDVSRAADWLGDAWVEALGHAGAGGGVAHRGPLVVTPWSRLVCFAGLGPGEVTVGGAKVVGISQRRTRGWARFQCALLHRWDPARVLAVLEMSAADRERATSDLAGLAAGLAVDPATVVSHLRAALDRAAG